MSYISDFGAENNDIAKEGCLFLTPGTVKLFESPTRGGGLPRRITKNQVTQI